MPTYVNMFQVIVHSEQLHTRGSPKKGGRTSLPPLQHLGSKIIRNTPASCGFLRIQASLHPRQWRQVRRLNRFRCLGDERYRLNHRGATLRSAQDGRLALPAELWLLEPRLPVQVFGRRHAVRLSDRVQIVDPSVSRVTPRPVLSQRRGGVLVVEGPRVVHRHRQGEGRLPEGAKRHAGGVRRRWRSCHRRGHRHERIAARHAAPGTVSWHRRRTECGASKIPSQNGSKLESSPYATCLFLSEKAGGRLSKGAGLKFMKKDKPIKITDTRQQRMEMEGVL